MSDFMNDGSLANIEAVIQSAGDFIQVSPDLRPILIESADDQLRPLKRRSLIAFALAICCLAVIFDWQSPTKVELNRISLLPASVQAIGSEHSTADFFKVASSLDKREPSWGLVHVFCEVQNRRAEVFNSPSL